MNSKVHPVLECSRWWIDPLEKTNNCYFIPQQKKNSVLFTFPIPGVSLTLLAARRRQGGAGGGAFMRAEQKLVENRGGSQDGDDVTGTAAAAAFCFFFFDDRFNFCAALREERQHTHTHSWAKMTPKSAFHCPQLPFIGQGNRGLLSYEWV